MGAGGSVDGGGEGGITTTILPASTDLQLIIMPFNKIEVGSGGVGYDFR